MANSLNLIFVTVIMIFIALELIIDRKEHRNLYNKKDSLHTIGIALGLFFVGFLNRSITVGIYYLVYSYRVFSLGNHWTIWLATLFVTDFCFYWYHRSAHSINWLWASHSVHHSSEEFNLSVAFRHSWTYVLSGQFLFWAWLPFFGVHPVVLMCAIQICTFYQGWLHTELIGKLHPVIEWIFNTPSHHRVHHGSDLKYLDKNSGAILIIWDRFFGTFQREEEKPIYGLTKKSASANISKILWGDWIHLFTKALSSGSLRNAINYMIMPPGWSHDGSSKTVKQMRTAAAHREAKKKCNRDCASCPFLKDIEMKRA